MSKSIYFRKLYVVSIYLLRTLVTWPTWPKSRILELAKTSMDERELDVKDLQCSNTTKACRLLMYSTKFALLSCKICYPSILNVVNEPAPQKFVPIPTPHCAFQPIENSQANGIDWKEEATCP